MNIRTCLFVGALLPLAVSPLQAQQTEPDDVLYGYIGSGSDSTFARYEIRWANRELQIDFAPYGRVPERLDDLSLTADHAQLSFTWPDGASCELDRSPTEGDSWQGFVNIHWSGRCTTDAGGSWQIAVGLEGPPDYGQRVPASDTDLRIIDRASELLANDAAWNRDDDRVCADDDQKRAWSLFCALYRASLDVAGEYLHARRAMDLVRQAARQSTGLSYVHTVLQYNNAPETSLEAIQQVLREGRIKVERALYNPF